MGIRYPARTRSSSENMRERGACWRVPTCLFTIVAAAVHGYTYTRCWVLSLGMSVHTMLNNWSDKCDKYEDSEHALRPSASTTHHLNIRGHCEATFVSTVPSFFDWTDWKLFPLFLTWFIFKRHWQLSVLWDDRNVIQGDSRESKSDSAIRKNNSVETFKQDLSSTSLPFWAFDTRAVFCSWQMVHLHQVVWSACAGVEGLHVSVLTWP